MGPIKTIIALFRLTLCWLLNAIYLPIASIINLCTLGLFYSHIISPLARIWGRSALTCLGVKLSVENQAAIDERSPRLLILNHTSTLDILIMAALFPVGGTAIGKKQLAYIPFLNLAWWVMGFAFLDREHKEKGKAQMNRFSNRVLSKKMTIIIAPEGTRSRTGELQKFKMGAFHVALNTKVPIVPMVIYNATELMPYNKFLPKTGTIHIKFLPPIETKEWKLEELHEKAEGVRNVFVEELKRSFP